MKPISTRVHGIVDYLVGLLLIAAPFVLGFADGGAKMWVPMILGAGTIVYSLFTDYELGVVRALPMRTHLAMDVGSGVFLAVSPWLFGFAEVVWVPHLLVGLAEIFVPALTQPRPSVSVIHPTSPRA